VGGALIIMNNDEPIQLMRGTFSYELKIEIPDGSLTNIVLFPTSPGIIFNPFQVIFNAGETSKIMKVGTSISTMKGIYFIQWKEIS